MFNIHLMGNLETFDQLIKNRTTTENAVQFEEEDTVRDIMIQGLALTIPLISIMIFAALVRFFSMEMHVHINLKTIILLVIAAASTYLLTYVHEFIHAIFYPKDSSKEMWKIPGNGVFFTYCETPVSRMRFIVLSIAPALILGVLPFILWMIFPTALPTTASLMVLTISIIMTYGGMGDFVNIINTVNQVPKGAKVFNFNIHSYWIKDLEKPWIVPEEIPECHKVGVNH